jgi:hypothetical protein
MLSSALKSLFMSVDCAYIIRIIYARFILHTWHTLTILSSTEVIHNNNNNNNKNKYADKWSPFIFITFHEYMICSLSELAMHDAWRTHYRYLRDAGIL